MTGSRKLWLGMATLAVLLHTPVQTPVQAQDDLAVKPLSLPINKKMAAEALGEYIRINTTTPPGLTTAVTEKVIGFLVERYAKPLGLEYEVYGRSLLLRWRSPKPEGRPIVFLSHSDVVPVADNEVSRWTHPPFAGVISGGYVWGRGALDTKSTTLCALEAIRALKASGKTPRRDIVLLINPDEEIGGFHAAKWFVKEHLDKLGNPEALFDEGSYVLPDILPGQTIAAVAVGEKGYLTVKLTVETQSGHASMPSADDSTVVLTRALSRFNDYAYPARFLPPTERFLDRMSEHVAFPRSMILSNRWAFGSIIQANFEAKPSTNAVQRTTHALTILQAGVKDNVIPRKAEAFVNFRLLPGDGKESVLAQMAQVMGDPRVVITEHEFWGESPLAPSDGPFWNRLESVLNTSLPGAFTAPMITPATTDGRYFAQAGIPTYRITPLTLDAAERQTVHGVNERVSLDNLEQAIRVYANMMIFL